VPASKWTRAHFIYRGEHRVDRLDASFNLKRPFVPSNCIIYPILSSWWDAIWALRPAFSRLLHHQPDSNAKPEYIMGHSMQAVSILVRAAQSVFAVPLAVRIHERLVWSNRDRRTLLDKMSGVPLDPCCAPARPGIPLSELVVANALRQRLPEPLVNSAKTHCFAKIIAEGQDPDKFEMFRLDT